MRNLIFGALLAAFMLLAGPISAQTTWNPSDAAAGITLSGGNLTATANGASSYKTVRATVAKYSGKSCYQFVVTNSSGFLSIGFAGASWPLTYQGPLGFTNFDFNQQIYSQGSAGLSQQFQQIVWNLVTTGATADPPVTGKTGELCANLDNQPPQIWATPDVTGTGGAGGGPKWNGSTTATPAGDVGGISIYLPGIQFFPAFDALTNDVATGIFTGFTPPSGYSTWDTAGGAASVPGPLNPLNINIANAPEWAASTGYALGKRVLAGAAWNGSAYTNGQPLCIFAANMTGTSGTDPTVFNTACASGTASNYGGGILGSIPAQWSTASTVTDGTVTWTLLSKVDYSTLTAVNADSATAWSTSTAFNYQTYVTNAGSGYSLCPGDVECDVPGTNNPECTSASSGSGPTGTTPDTGITDGTCTWYFIGAIPYTSQTHRFPHLYTINGGPQDILLQGYNFDVNVVIWDGGTGRPEYITGQHNERAGHMLFSDHYTAMTELGIGCYHAFFNATPPTVSALAGGNCKGIGTTWQTILKPAPGDGWKDNVTASIGPLGVYDPTKGVSLYSPDAYSVSFAGWSVYGDPIDGDPTSVTGLQLKALHGPAIRIGTNGGYEVNDNILEGGDSSPVVAYMGAGLTAFDNNLLISHSTDNGCMAVFSKYYTSVYNNTAIGPNNADCTFVAFFDGAGIGTQVLVVANNNAFGFSNFFAAGPGGSFSASPTYEVGNATSGSACCGAAFSTSSDFIYGALTFTPEDISAFQNTCGPSNTGSCLNLSAANQFVDPTIGSSLDMRVKSGADIIGGGALFSYLINGESFYFLSPITPPSTDILGTARPTAGRYDVGAAQFLGSSPISPHGPGRFMRGDNDNFLPFLSGSAGQ